MTSETAQKILEMTKADYERIAYEFAETRNRVWPEVVSLAEHYIKAGDNILEVGSGNGRLYDILKKKDINYIGLDRSENFVRVCEKKYEAKYGSLHFQIGDALELPYHEPIFDSVFLLAVLNHIPTLELQYKVLHNIFTVTKPGGYLIMTNWNLWRPTMRQKSVWQFWKEKRLYDGGTFEEKYGIASKELSFRDIVTLWGSMQHAGHLYYYAFTLKQLRHLVKAAGFSLVQSYYAKLGRRVHWWNGYNIVVVARKEV